MADAKMAERLQNAISAVERGSRLTAQLLAFARRQVLEPRSVNLSRLVREITDLLRRTLGEHVEIECVIGGGLWNVLVDPAQVENAIINLAINSRDAMPDGGKLTIEISNAFLDDEYAARHFEVAAGQYVALAVSDTGAGMPPEIIARVFDPFFTTKPEGKGTGLGLSQVHGFVKQSGGHIKIYSEPGRGTTVKLYLPRTRKPQELQEPIIPTANIVGGSETILVVEDDENVRGAAIDILTDLGYAVLKAENADQALAILKSGARVDLLFTDVVMPGSLNARDFTRLAEKLCPKMRILYSSGYTQNAIVHNGQLDDNISLLGKPYRKDILALKIRSLLDGSPENSFAPEPTVMSNAQLITKVLIVEDVSLIRMTTVDMIEEIGLVAQQASNGPDALKILRADSEIGVLLTDLGLPGMSGNELIDEALKLRPDLRIVIASGRLTAEGAEASRANVVRLSKPFNSSDLKRALGA
jgi:CheY-like chemotaxis protein